MPRELASIIIPDDAWRWVALAAAVVLVPLAVLALRPGATRKQTTAVALGLRTLGIGLLLFCLLDPQWTSPHAKPGANLIAVLVDNSASLTITDAGAKQTRGQAVKDALTSPDSHWLATLAEQYQLKPYIFDTTLRRVQDFSELDFSGERTALGTALRKVQDNLSGQPLAGVMVFTDGDATDLAGGIADLGNVPIYPVLIGKAEGLRDIRLEHVDVRQTAFDDAPVAVHAEIAGQGVGAQNLQVAVRSLNAPALKKNEVDPTPTPLNVHLAGDTEPAESDFAWHPLGSGPQFFEVSVAAAGGKSLDEATLANNHRVIMVDRGRPAYRILYVSGLPNWEFKFLNRAVEEDPQLQMVGLIRVAKREPKLNFIGRDPTNLLFAGTDQAKDDSQAADQPVIRVVNAKTPDELRAGFPTSAATLFAYDAVVLDKVEAGFFTNDQLAILRRFVSERGGGLLMLGGVDSLDAGNFQNTALAPALPVYLDRKAPIPQQGELSWNLTREGWLEPWTRVRSTQAEEDSVLTDMPHFLVTNTLNGIKPGATVLATVTDQGSNVFPALIAQNYGSGRVACLTIGDMSTWNFTGDTGHDDLAHFWRQLARWLVTDDPAPVEMKIVQADDGHSVTLRVTAHDQNFRPLDLGNTTVIVSRVATSSADAGAANGTSAPAFEKVTLPADPVPDAPGQFAATFTPRDAGAYLAEAHVLDRDGKVIGTAQSGWVNDPATEEFQSLAPNLALMQDIARRTGGEVIPWDKLDEFVKSLPNRKAPVTDEESHPLWQQGPVFLAVLMCFLAEWGWRRWKGLP